jgi:hypothetical protein
VPYDGDEPDWAPMGWVLIVMVVIVALFLAGVRYFGGG